MPNSNHLQDRFKVLSHKDYMMGGLKNFLPQQQLHDIIVENNEMKESLRFPLEQDQNTIRKLEKYRNSFGTLPQNSSTKSLQALNPPSILMKHEWKNEHEMKMNKFSLPQIEFSGIQHPY
jgi:hypothetical protein